MRVGRIAMRLVLFSLLVVNKACLLIVLVAFSMRCQEEETKPPSSLNEAFLDGTRVP